MKCKVKSGRETNVQIQYRYARIRVLKCYHVAIIDAMIIATKDPARIATKIHFYNADAGEQKLKLVAK